MYKIKICLLIISLTGIFYTLNAQAINIKRKINWKNKQLFYAPAENDEQKTSKFILYFENAVYKHELNDLPYYSELLPLNHPAYSFSIKNQVFRTMDKDELDKVSGLDAISENIEISEKIVYIRKQAYLLISFIPVRKNESGQTEKLLSFEIELLQKGQNNTEKKKTKNYVSNSVLQSGKWIKIKIAKSGIYKLTFNELIELGIENPAKVRIFGNGGKMLPFYNNEISPDDLKENKILKQNEAIYFYGEGPTEWKRDPSTNFFRQQKHLYADYSWYFISSDYDSQINNLIETENQTSLTATHSVNTFNDYAFHEIDSVNLIGSGRLWVGENFNLQTAYSYNFSFPNLLDGSLINAETSLLARSPISSSFVIEINNQSFSSVYTPVSYSYTSKYAIHKKEKFSLTTSASNNVEVKIDYNKYTASAEAWLDYITINVIRQLKFGNEQMHFRHAESVGENNVGQFTISETSNQTRIWDISNKQEPRQIDATLNGTNLSFKLKTDSLREFIAFDLTMAYSPITSGDDTGLVENQNLHGISHADMVIVSHPEFYEYAEALKQIHEDKDKLTIVLVQNQQVYNEFSSGAPDVSAIRNFIKMLYDKAATESEMPKYLLLFGDGSYDNKSVSGKNTNFILTYQSENSLNPTESFVTDDFFGLLDDNEGGHEGYLDLGIGRLPVKSKTEASNALNKIRSYMDITAYSDWRNNICFIADDEDYNTHIAQADELSRIVKNNYPVFNIEKIYLDAFVQQSTSSGQRYPEVNLTIDNLIAKGLLLINYTGHGNESWLAEENILSIDQINKYDNINKLPVFMTATCEFSRFDNYLKTTAGEYTFLNPKGAAIALFTTTRLVYASPNFELNKSFYRYVFENNPSTGSRYSFGDIMRLTKIGSGEGINKRNFTLLGDPALKLSYAPLNVKTNTINQSPANELADTLKAYQKITIQGEIQYLNGIKFSDYNGLIYPKVFDKKQEIKTLDNDGEGGFTYSIINSPVFKGKASVRNGDFQFSFIVPKDIRYHVDTGKISYYSTNYELLGDAKGYFTNFLIGGISDAINSDNNGPEIKIYLNDDKFVDGGITDKNPKLLVYLSDSSGINTTGSGIGHDIVASIDNNSDLKFIVNDYYESDIDDYTKGKVNYNLPELTSGEHTIRLKAWDVFNNSSEDSINFIVANSDQLEISHVLNYPNPFSSNTKFFFEHNRPNELLEVMIQIFTVSGKVIKTIFADTNSNGYRIEGIPWDGKDDFGNKLGRGAYFYKITVKSMQGERTNKIQKLLILN